MLNKSRYLIYSYDSSENLFRVHFIGSLRSCVSTIDRQIKITSFSRFPDFFKVMSVSDFAKFHTLLEAKVSYPLNMSKKDLEALAVDASNVLYSLGFSGSDRFVYAK